MTGGPLDHTTDFWKPLIDSGELESLAVYRDPGSSRSPGLNVWRSDAAPSGYRVADGDAQFSLFAGVHPIPDVPDAAESIAQVLDRSGALYSHVLWYPREGCVVLPFDPIAAIEALWRETYVPVGEKTVLPQSVLTAYYLAKPMIPTGVKGRLRRRMARRALAADHFLDWPSDDSLDALQRLMLRLILMCSERDRVRFAWFWPDQRPWAAVLTHDVETGAGVARVSLVAEMEAKRGLRSSFNFVPLDYETPDSLIGALRADGFEIGVHGLTHDGLLCSKWSTFMDRLTAINERARIWEASGFRSPATYRNLEWFQLLEFEYDSSVADTAPLEPQPGGCGSFFPYLVGELIELPITLPQDHTLFGLLGQTSAGVWRDNLRRIRAANGMACLLTHPDPDTGYIGMPQNEAHYVGLLDDLADSAAWCPLPRDLARWWRARAAVAPDRIGEVEGVTFGSATLDASGRLQILPPSATPAKHIAGFAPVGPGSPVPGDDGDGDAEPLQAVQR